jgi:hypothetical protein
MPVVIKRSDAMMRAGKYADGSRIEPVRKEVQAEDPMLLLVKSIQSMIAQIPVLLDRQNAQHELAMQDMMAHMMTATKREAPIPPPVKTESAGEEWEIVPVRDASGRMTRATFKRMK